MKKIIRLTENDLTRIIKRVMNEQKNNKQNINEGHLHQGNFGVGQKFDEVHNRQFIMSLNYSAAGRGSTDVYNDFEFKEPKIVSVDGKQIILKIASGFYNPASQGTGNFVNLSEFCMSIPYDRMQEIRENQLMVSIPNPNLQFYIDNGCTKYKADVAVKLEKAKKCGWNSWAEYKRSNWVCKPKK